LVRRAWIGLPIGMLMHLVLDGIWARPEVFWWPFLGWSFPAGGLPEFGRSLGVVALLELVGLAALWWMVRTFELATPAHRDRLLRTGQLPRDTGPQGPEATC
jgi:hypothetical protein